MRRTLWPAGSLAVPDNRSFQLNSDCLPISSGFNWRATHRVLWAQGLLGLPIVEVWPVPSLVGVLFSGAPNLWVVGLVLPPGCLSLLSTHMAITISTTTHYVGWSAPVYTAHKRCLDTFSASHRDRPIWVEALVSYFSVFSRWHPHLVPGLE